MHPAPNAYRCERVGHRTTHHPHPRKTRLLRGARTPSQLQACSQASTKRHEPSSRSLEGCSIRQRWHRHQQPPMSDSWRFCRGGRSGGEGNISHDLAFSHSAIHANQNHGSAARLQCTPSMRCSATISFSERAVVRVYAVQELLEYHAFFGFSLLAFPSSIYSGTRTGFGRKSAHIWYIRCLRDYPTLSLPAPLGPEASPSTASMYTSERVQNSKGYRAAELCCNLGGELGTDRGEQRVRFSAELSPSN